MGSSLWKRGEKEMNFSDWLEAYCARRALDKQVVMELLSKEFG